MNPGDQLGHYAVTAKLGAGGMGEVYRATDSKLGRDVALKVLPAAFTADPQRMARFQREAQVLASLNHPNIATIHGLEESGATRALVMELVEGPTLAERIASGAIPLDEALPIAKQLAEALEYAHEKGIVHRDLKPANIKLTHDGQVKVLDFGLAKAMQDDSSSPDVSNSPTLSMAATKAGVILGTAAYMSPEQAKGRVVDRRTDVWAFGCVLYEMLTGKRAFPGEDVSETLAAIIRGEPDWTALPGNVPASVARLLKRCLMKDLRRRLQAIGEARLAIENYLEDPAADAVPTVGVVSSQSTRPIWALAIMTVVALAFATAYFLRPAPETPVVRAFIPAPDKTNFDFIGNPSTGPPAISPDGRWIVFAAHPLGGQQVLWLRALSEETARPLAGTEAGAFPFWSPDSREIGFFALEKLKKIAVSGGPPIAICEAPSGRGGTWNRGGLIVFGDDANSPLHVVSAAGGPSRRITQLEQSRAESSHRWPHFLPDGKRFLYLARSGQGGTVLEAAAIWVGSVEGGPPRLVVRAPSNAVYAGNYILFARESLLMAQGFDANTLELKGEPLPLVEKVQFDQSFSRGVFSVSETGVLVYQSGEASPDAKLTWLDRKGKEVGVLGAPGIYTDVKISPDARKVAVGIAGVGPPDLWIYDAVRGVRTRFTFDPNQETHPIWSPDGKRIVYRSSRRGIPDLYQKSVDGVEEGKPLLESDIAKFPRSWSADGRFIAYDLRGVTGTFTDIWVLPTAPPGAPKPFLQSRFRESQPQFSPDGRWVAYVSDESFQNEVYVSPFPNAGRKWQISTGGGSEPRWRGDGKEIFYVGEDNTVRAVEVTAQPDTLSVGAAKSLFRVPLLRRNNSYDVTRDGQRFLAIQLLHEGTSEPMTLVVNWPALLSPK